MAAGERRDDVARQRLVDKDASVARARDDVASAGRFERRQVRAQQRAMHLVAAIRHQRAIVDESARGARPHGASIVVLTWRATRRRTRLAHWRQHAQIPQLGGVIFAVGLFTTTTTS